MIQKIKNYFLIASSALMLAVPAVVPVSVHAECSNIANKVQEGANGASGESISCDTENANGNSISELGRKVVNLFSLIIGVIAIIMIIYGGFRYITSGGASERVGNAKNTLIYAIVGLIIVALAQIIVHFVLNQTGQAVTG